MVIFSKTVHWIELKISMVVLHDVMHPLSKFHEDPTYKLKDMPKSHSVLLNMKTMYCSWTSRANISKTTNWVGLKFCNKVSTIIVHLLTKNCMNPHHGFREKCELAVGDDNHFLENRTLDWAETCHGYSTCCYEFPVQISWGSNSWFVRYPQIKLFIFLSAVDE